jgi:hypothetical protein
MTTYSLDTDTIIKLLKKHPGEQPVIDRFRQEIQRNSLFVICPVAYYEMRRRLLFKGGWGRLRSLESAISRGDRGRSRGISSQLSAKGAFGRSQTLENNLCASPPNRRALLQAAVTRKSEGGQEGALFAED